MTQYVQIRANGSSAIMMEVKKKEGIMVCKV